jgi:hypothetical protein
MIRYFLVAAIVLGSFLSVTLYAGPPPSSTFVAGVENSLPNTSEENIGDYNDMIFSLSGSGLTLDTPNGQWNAFSAGIVNQNGNGNPAGNPFFDNLSLDGTDKNIGFCLTTSNCGANTQTAGASLNEYLSDSGNTSIPAPDFYFTSSGSVTFSLLAAIAAGATDTESVGIYDTTGSHTVTWVIQDDVLTDATPTLPGSGTFGLIFEVGTGGTFYYSQNSSFGFVNGMKELPDDNRYALFSEAEGVPEPATMALFGIGALALGLVGRLRKRRG